ncbi:MAG: PAS domain S-box protein [Spirochaetes bacterium]|nr:PAS domain S-box protein [Spirochaetota bacterium]
MRGVRRHIWGLILILIAASTLTGTIASLVLYQTAIKQKSDFLLTEVMNLSRLIDAVARFDRHTFTEVNRSTAATLSQVEAAFKDQRGFGQSGEILMARREGGKVAIFLRYRGQAINQNLVLPHDPGRTEAMHLALQGKSGVGEFTDFRGDRVLAAYTFVDFLQTGLEIKINMAEIMRPYMVNGLIIALASAGVILICVLLFLRISRPVLEELEKHRILTEAVFASAQDMILSLDRYCLMRLVNPAVRAMLGFGDGELLQRDFSIIFDGADANTARILGEIRNHTFDNASSGTVVVKKKNGELFPASITSGEAATGDTATTTIILHDLTALKRSEATIRMLNHRMIEIKDAEQDTISREIHDNIGTNLVWLKLQAQQLLQKQSANGEATADFIKNFDDTIEATRSLSHSLSPLAIEKLSLGVMLRRLADRAHAVSKTRVEFDDESVDFDLPPKTRFHIYRIVQEALNNALRHADAKLIRLECVRSGATLIIRISDDGKGININRETQGLGLSLMRERAHLVKGTLKISSTKKGSEVQLEIPL